MIVRVAPEEHDLLTVTRALFDPRQHGMVAPLVRTARPLRASIGRSSMGVLQDILAKGLVRLLARDLVSAEAPLPKAPALSFSASTFELLAWLVRTPLAAANVPKLGDEGAPLTFADQMVIILSAELATTAAVLAPFLQQPYVRRAPLLALWSTDELPLAGTLDLEATALLPRTFARRLVLVEQAKARLFAPEPRTRIGEAQAALLNPLVKQAIDQRRWDAVRFLLDGLSACDPTVWQAPLEPSAPLSARAEARRTGVSPLRAIAAIAATHARARMVGFVDDDYEEAQKTVRALAPWEDLFARAETVVRAADQLEELR